MSIKNLVTKSLWKGLRDTGVIIGTAAAMGGLLMATTPEALIPLALAVGPFAPVVMIGVPILARAAMTALKHRKD